MKEFIVEQNSEQVSTCIHNKKIALVWLLATVYIAFICLQLGQIQAISDFSYRLHELFYLPVNAAIFLVPVELVVYLYVLVRCMGKNKKQSGTGSKVVVLFVWISLVLIVYTLYYQSFENHTGGIFKVVDRLRANNKYYVVISDGRKIRCTRNEYYLIAPGQEYAIDFNWNSYSGKGNLEVVRTKQYALQNND